MPFSIIPSVFKMFQWIFVFIWTLLCLRKGIHCTICSEAAASDNTRVIRMCESGSVKTDRVVIDTYGTGAPDIHICTCTATRYITSSYLVSFGIAYNLKQNEDCGSTLTVESPNKDPVVFKCVSPTIEYYEKRSSLEFTLSRTIQSNPWRYGHCILLETDTTKWNITCLPPVKLNTSFSTTSLQTSAITTAFPTSVSAKQTTLFTSSEVNTGNVCATQTIEVFSIETVVIPIVVVVLIAAVATIANVILYRRRLSLGKNTEKKDLRTPRPMSLVYDTIDTDRLEAPNIYDDTTTGRMYVNTAAGINAS